MATEQDTLNIMAFLNDVIKPINDPKLRDQELSKYIENLKARGQNDLASSMSGLYKDSLGGSTFNAIDSLDTIKKTDFSNTDNYHLNTNISKAASSIGDIDVDAKRASLHEGLKIKLAEEVDKYNQFKLINKEAYEERDAANARYDSLINKLDKLSDIEYNLEGPSQGRNYSFWEKNVAKRHVIKNNPDLLASIALAKENKDSANLKAKYLNPEDMAGGDRSLAFAPTSSGLRGVNAYNQTLKIDEIVKSLNYLESDDNKTNLRTVPIQNRRGDVINYTYPEQIILSE